MFFYFFYAIFLLFINCNLDTLASVITQVPKVAFAPCQAAIVNMVHEYFFHDLPDSREASHHIFMKCC